MTTITNVHVSNLSHDYTRAALGWTKGDHRYHIWFNVEERQKRGAVYGDGTVFKNPISAPRRTSRRDPTITMKAKSGPNERMLIEAWRIVDRDDLIQRAIIAAQEEETRRLAKANAEADIARKRFYGPEMYDVLREIMDHAQTDNIITRSLYNRIEEVLLQAETGEGYAYSNQ